MKKITLLFAFMMFSILTFSQKWTVLVYMVGSDLESGSGAATTDILEMIEVGSNPNLDIVITTGGANVDRTDEGLWDWRKIKRWKVVSDDVEAIPFTTANNDMADPINLAEFLYWGVTTYPADKYCLILWDHGGAIDGFGHDEVSGNMLSVEQITNALDASYSYTDVKFDLLGFDACLMSNLEVMYNLKNYADYFVASEEVEPGHGWDYTYFLNKMVSKSITTGNELGKHIADGYLQHAKNEGTSEITLAVTDLSEIDNVMEKLEALVYKLTLPPVKRSIYFTPVAHGRASAEDYGKSAENPGGSFDVVDLVDFANNVKQFDETFAPECDALIASVEQAIDYKVKDQTKPNSNGMTIYLPYNQFADSEVVIEKVEKYKALNFSTDYQNFVIDYVNQAFTDDTPPEVPAGIMRDGNIISANCISPDLDKSYVILMDAQNADQNIVDFMGVMLPDDITPTVNGQKISFEWTGQWIGINGIPAYISDIEEETFTDDEGNTFSLFLMQIPANLNSESIILNFILDEEANYILAGISPDIDLNGFFPKEMIDITAGDLLTLQYVRYNIEDETYSISESEPLTLNSIDDIELTISNLSNTPYLLGFYLLDYFKNETVLISEDIFTPIIERVALNNLKIYPNPASQFITISAPFGDKPYNLDIIDLSGKSVMNKQVSPNENIDVSALENGVYILRINYNEQFATTKLVISK